MRVERTRQGPTLKKTRSPAAAEGFGELLSQPEAAAAEAAAPAPRAAGVGSLIGAESAADPEIADREARRHGNAMLQALGALQVALLSGSPADLRGALADLASRIPNADDPALRVVLREIGVRAAVELARHGASSLSDI